MNQESANLKYRGPREAKRTAQESHAEGRRGRQFKNESRPLSTSHILSTIGLMFCVFYIVNYMEQRLPVPLTEQDLLKPENRGRFIAEKAITFLSELTALGPRVAGSYENDVLAVEFMDKKMREIDRRYNNGVHKVEVERQVASGAYQLAFLDGMTMQYNDIHNVIVRIEANTPTNQSLLMNCHFDSVPDSPGASDDGAACAVMTELYRVIIATGMTLNYNVIFLFNGAEENIMQGSHGFITSHRWAKEIQGFINLEACGAGGRELLFQAGPSNPHLLDVYSQVVPYPYASTLAQEIFQSGIIPGETDFRIFRDFGGLSGVDFAWSDNGYVYHTKYDNIAQIPWGSLQRTGDNMLALIKGISEKGIRVQKNEKSHNLVFFDILGAFVVRWKVTLSLLINGTVASLSALSIWHNLRRCRELDGICRSDYYKEVCYAMRSQGMVWIGSIVVSLLIAAFLIALDKTMSWFGRPTWVYFLYVIPTMATGFVITRWSAERTAQRLQSGNKKTLLSSWTVFQVYFDATQILWTLIMIITVSVGVLSGFIAILWVLFAALQNMVHHRFAKSGRGWKWLACYVVLIGIPFLQSYYLALGAINMFLPIMGRTGSAFNSEFIIAFLMSLIFTLLFSFISQLIIVARSPKVILRLPAIVTLLAVAVVLFTDLGFPYSGQLDRLTPQRFIVSNVDKKAYDYKGHLLNHKTGYWFIDMDVNSPRSIQKYIPEVEHARLVDTCEDEIYCGLPYILPVLNFLWVTHWLDSPPFQVPLETEVILNEKTLVHADVVRLNFTVTGPDHMNLMFSPLEAFELKRWSIDESVPLAGSKRFKNRKMYFVYYSYGQVNRPWHFHLDFAAPKGYKIEEAVVDLSVNGHFIHGERKLTNQLKVFVDRFPDWTTTSAWTSTIRSFVF